MAALETLMIEAPLEDRERIEAALSALPTQGWRVEYE